MFSRTIYAPVNSKMLIVLMAYCTIEGFNLISTREQTGGKISEIKPSYLVSSKSFEQSSTIIAMVIIEFSIN